MALLRRLFGGGDEGERPGPSKQSDEPGLYQGRHFTEWVEELDRLRRSGEEDAYEQLLLGCVGATEREARADGMGVAPAYYERLAVLYRKRGDHAAEVEILERFAEQEHAPGARPPKLMERLEKARSLRDSSDDS